MRIDNTFIAHFCCNGLVFSLFIFLVTMKMLTDRAGCYNVRGKKLIVRKLIFTVNSYGIATFSVRGEGLRFFDSLKCMNTISRGFQMTVMVLQHLKLHKLFTFSAHRESPGAAGDRGKFE